MKQKSGFTVLEAIISIAVILILMALLTPLFAAAKRKAQITSSVARHRQLFLGLEVYRQNQGVTEIYDSPRAYYALGLPSWRGTYTLDHFGLTPRDLHSPCGEDLTIHESSGITQGNGWITFICPAYDPQIMVGGANIQYATYLQKYRENAVAFFDGFCNPAGTRMNNPFVKKRGIAVSISGQLFNRVKDGRVFELQWWSDPAEQD